MKGSETNIFLGDTFLAYNFIPKSSRDSDPVQIAAAFSSNPSSSFTIEGFTFPPHDECVRISGGGKCFFFFLNRITQGFINEIKINISLIFNVNAVFYISLIVASRM